MSPAAQPLVFAGVAGSLRERSFNRALLRAAAELAPESIRIREVPIGDLPFYNPDLDRGAALPDAVQPFRAALREADALLIATPEYNYGVPAPLKNALDWGSRPVRAQAPLFEKPVGLLGTSPGAAGTARAQEQLKLILLATGAYPMANPALAINSAPERFDDERRLIDDSTRERILVLLERLAEWTRRLSRPATPA